MKNKQGRIVHRRGLNNENNEIKTKNTKNRTVQWLKLTFSELKRKINFINKQRNEVFFSKSF